MNKYFRIFGLATLLSVFIVMAFAACNSDSDNNTPSQKLTVIASTPILADWVNQVGGERVEVKSIVPEGINPHGFQPGSKTLTEIASADAVFLVGLGYEGLWMTKLIENNDEIPFTTLGDITEPLHDDHDEDHDEHEDHDEDHEKHEDHDEDHEKHEDHDEDHEKHEDHDEDHEKHEDHDEDHEKHEDHDEHEGHDDHDHELGNPHFWFDPIRVVAAVDAIAASLTRVDPESADLFEKNANDYKNLLNKLDEEIASQINTIPESNRTVMTEHQSLLYFTEKYGLKSIESVIPYTRSDVGPTPRDLEKAIEAVKHHNLKIIFVEFETNKAAAQRVAEESGIKLSEELQVETLKENQSYEDFMRQNVSIIVSGLSD